MTYGYLGKAADLWNLTLGGGSLGNHLKNHGIGINDLKNEVQDEAMIIKGTDWYREVHK